MVRIYTLTLAPSLDSATITRRFIPKANYAVLLPFLNLVVAESTSPELLLILAAARQRYSRQAVLRGASGRPACR